MALNKSKFLNTVAERAGVHRRDVEHVWEHAIATIQDAIRKGEDVTITGFGKFKQRVVKARKAGTARNPFTGEMVKVAAKPASKAPRFLPAKQFKEYVGGQLKSLPKMSTRPMALASGNGGGKSTAKKSTGKSAAKKSGAKKSTGKKKTAARKR